MSELVCFRGPVRCARDAPPLALTLEGVSAAGEPTTLAFSAAAPPGLPEQLPDATVEQLQAQRYRIVSSAGTWTLSAPAAHLHRDIGAAFYAALPPRPTPRARRLLWRVLLALAASRAGLKLLRALRR